MKRAIRCFLVVLVFSAPLIFSHATTEVYGLIKIAAIELFALVLFVLLVGSRLNLGARFNLEPRGAGYLAGVDNVDKDNTACYNYINWR